MADECDGFGENENVDVCSQRSVMIDSVKTSGDDRDWLSENEFVPKYGELNVSETYFLLFIFYLFLCFILLFLYFY